MGIDMERQTKAGTTNWSPLVHDQFSFLSTYLS